MEHITIALVDDHVLFRNALSTLIKSLGIGNIVLEAGSGLELKEKLANIKKPDVILLDLNMPGMDGYCTAEWLAKTYPEIKVIILTMFDSELSLIRLLKANVSGFVKKDIAYSELKFAILSVMKSGHYFSTHTTGRLANLFRCASPENSRIKNATLEDRELEFLKLACSDMTYKEIAQSMQLSPRSIDALRDHMFLKLDVKSRVGLAMVAVRNGVINFSL